MTARHKKRTIFKKKILLAGLSRTLAEEGQTHFTGSCSLGEVGEKNMGFDSTVMMMISEYTLGK
jgi:hypothetical protein